MTIFLMKSIMLSKNYFLLNYNVLDLEFYWKDWYIIASIKKIANSWVFISHRTLSCNKQISVRPHRWQPTRLPCPWDSPGKNTGVGCHFFLQCMKVKSESEVSQSCPTLSNPMDCSLPVSSVHGIFQPRVPEWSAIAFSNYTH